METQTRFDLNAAIANWQQELAVQPDLTPIMCRELETHLRDTIAELQARGLNNEESFWLARRRVGRPEQLNEEFAKADPMMAWRERAFWGMLALLTISLWNWTFSYLLDLLNAAGKMSSDRAVVLNGVYIFIRWLPILACAVLIAKGRYKLFAKIECVILNSRLRIAAMTSLWALINGALLGAVNRHWAPAFISAFLWPYILVGLLMWLMQKKAYPKPRRA